MHGQISEALSGTMANQMYVVNLDTEQQLQAYYRDLLEREKT